PAPVANWARPTVPPAPGTLMTCTELASPVSVITCWMARAAPSQPPPAPAGAMMVRSPRLSASCAIVGPVMAATASRPVEIMAPNLFIGSSLMNRASEHPTGAVCRPLLWTDFLPGRESPVQDESDDAAPRQKIDFEFGL